jgi:hypothetical protein
MLEAPVSKLARKSSFLTEIGCTSKVIYDISISFLLCSALIENVAE